MVNVVENSHSDKPLLYKITGVWGNHEGSMLLWVFILTLCGAAVAWFGDNLPPELRAARARRAGHDRDRLPALHPAHLEPVPARSSRRRANGQGLNPVLQDPGLAFHPPFLYLGYVGFSVAFSFAVAALIEGRVDAAWARWVRPWTLAAWCALTIGIAMGSWWAYYTLGWGGWWFWDPVENASLMPWLAGTALIHSSIVVEKRDTLKSWTVLLAIITFSLSLVGTFLVRSGVLTSVHAFAVDPLRGTFILLLLLVAIGGSLALYAVRAPALKGGGLFAPISREGALVLNNLLLDLRRGDGVPRHALSAVPRRGGRAQGLGRLSVLRPHLRAADGAAAAGGRGRAAAGVEARRPVGRAAAAVGRLGRGDRGDRSARSTLTHGGPVLAVLGFGLAAWVAAAALVEWAERVRLFRAPAGRELAPRHPSAARRLWHDASPISASPSRSPASPPRPSSRSASTPCGRATSVAVAGFMLRLRPASSSDRGRTSPPTAAASSCAAATTTIAVLHPERRFFPLQQMTTSKTAIRTNFLADLYLALGDPDGQGGWTVRAY